MKIIRNILIVCLALCLLGCSHHDPWTKADTARHVGYTVLHLQDYKQTRQIAKNPDRWHENNFILGEHPSKSRVDIYFAATWLGMTGLAYVLPRGWRDGLQYLGIAVEGYCVGHNYSIGLTGEW